MSGDKLLEVLRGLHYGGGLWDALWKVTFCCITEFHLEKDSAHTKSTITSELLSFILFHMP